MTIGSFGQSWREILLDDGVIMSEERLRRWRLILGGEEADGVGMALQGTDLAMDNCLRALYDAQRGGLGGALGLDAAFAAGFAAGLAAGLTAAAWVGASRGAAAGAAPLATARRAATAGAGAA